MVFNVLRRSILRTNLTSNRAKLSTPKRILLYSVLLPYGFLSLIPTYFTINSFYNKSRAILARDSKQKHDYHCIGNGYAFYAITGYLSLPLSIILFICLPYDLYLYPGTRPCCSKIQKIWAQWTLKPFINIKDIVTDNSMITDSSQEPFIIISNHLSWLDIYLLLALDFPTPVKFVSKQNIFLVPLVGWVMKFIGHLPLDRKNKESGKNILKLAEESVLKGNSVVFFPEGTRGNGTFFKPFKIGAFKVAEQASKQVLPIVISGSIDIMPCKRRNHNNFFYFDRKQVENLSITVLKPRKILNPSLDMTEIKHEMSEQYTKNVT